MDSVLILPMANTILAPAIADCPARKAWGEIDTTGRLKLNGLEPDKMYFLALIGEPGTPLHETLCQSWKEYRSTSGCWWEFGTVITDATGEVSDFELVVVLPEGVEVFAGETYDAGFFVKDAQYCTVLGSNSFTFMLAHQ